MTQDEAIKLLGACSRHTDAMQTLVRRLRDLGVRDDVVACSLRELIHETSHVRIVVQEAYGLGNS